MTDKTRTSDTQPQQQDRVDDAGDKPLSMRDTIRAAIQEQKEKAADENKTTEQPTKKEEVPSFPGQKAPEAKKAEAKKADEKKPDEQSTEVKKADDKKVEPSDEGKIDPTDKKDEQATEPKEKGKVKAPFGVDKELRAVWDDLPEIAQQRFAKLTKESLDRKAEEGRRAPFRDIEQVLSPLMPELQQVGVTPAQFVKRLVDYTYALASPKHQYQAIAQLAHDYNIDLSLFGGATKASEKEQNDQGDLPVDNIPPELNQKLDTILNRFSQLETVQKTENEKAAANQINDWSGFNPATGEYTKKPFYPYVRQTMYSLIASGTVPLKDGKIDLDGAYEAACYAHPETRDYMAEEQNRSSELERLKQEQTRQQQIERAKNAGSSLRPGAPVTRSPGPAIKTNSKGQPLTVRDSLRAAIAEMRNAQ